MVTFSAAAAAEGCLDFEVEGMGEETDDEEAATADKEDPVAAAPPPKADFFSLD